MKTGKRWHFLNSGTPLEEPMRLNFREFCVNLIKWCDPSTPNSEFGIIDCEISRISKELSAHSNSLSEGGFNEKFPEYMKSGLSLCIARAKVADSDRPVFGNEISRCEITKRLLLELGGDLYFKFSNEYYRFRLDQPLSPVDYPEPKNINYGRVQVSSSVRKLFESLSALSEVIAFCFSDPTRVDQLSQRLEYTGIKDVRRRIGKLNQKREEILKLAPELEVSFEGLSENISAIESSIAEKIECDIFRDKAIDLVLRFNIHDEDPVEHIGESVLKKLIHRSIMVFGEGGYKLYRNYRTHIKPVIRDGKYKYLSSNDSFYEYGNYEKRSRQKKTIPIGSAE